MVAAILGAKRPKFLEIYTVSWCVYFVYDYRIRDWTNCVTIWPSHNLNGTHNLTDRGRTRSEATQSSINFATPPQPLDIPHRIFQKPWSFAPTPKNNFLFTTKYISHPTHLIFHHHSKHLHTSHKIFSHTLLQSVISPLSPLSNHTTLSTSVNI